MDLQPFSSESDNTIHLRDITDSTCIPDSMKEVFIIFQVSMQLSSLIHYSSLKNTLKNIWNTLLPVEKDITVNIKIKNITIKKILSKNEINMRK